MQFGLKTLKTISVVFLGILLLSCGVVPPKNGTTIDLIGDALSEGMDPQTQPETPPPQVSAALLPSINIQIPTPTGESGVSEPRFDVAANNVNAHDFFMSLVEGTTINLVVDPELTGEITLNLKNVTIQETMEIVRDIYGYEYQKTNLGYMVFARKIQSRIFSVNYLNIKRQGISEMRVTSGQLTQSNNSGDTGSSDSSGNNNNTSSKTTGSVIKTSSEVDFWTDLSAALKSILGEGEGKSVVVNPPSGLVVVRAMPAELKNIEDFIRQIHNVTERQVILEAKILEVELSDGFQSGINWASLGTPKDGGTIVAGQVGGGTLITNGTSEILNNAGVLDPRNLAEISGTNASAFGGMFSLALNLNEFNAFIELLETQGNVQVLSSPRVSTVNNQKAIIKVGSDEYFVTEVETNVTTSAAGGESVNPSVKLTPFFSGIALDVTPQITEGGMVTLHIHPSVSQVEDQTKTFTVGGDPFSIPLAFSSTRESDSIIRAQNGQIVVIGGLMKNQTSETVASVPLLGKLPLIGSLFRHTKQVSQKSELVILLRPVVIENGQQWAQVRDESKERFNNLNRGFHYGSKLEVFGSMGEGSTN